jgi:alginate O-acetyltransferase complex protein AlgI
MVFSSAAFLFFFLPAILGAYYLAPRRYRNAVLVGFSLFFYAWGAGWITFVLLGSIAVNYVVGLRVERAQDDGDRRRAQSFLALGVVVNVALLVWFKYANFAVATWGGFLAAAGLPELPWADILLPIGISFYTFHALSYLIDIYRGTARHLVAPVDRPHHLPAAHPGPIVGSTDPRPPWRRTHHAAGISSRWAWARRSSSPTPSPRWWGRSSTPRPVS